MDAFITGMRLLIVVGGGLLALVVGCAGGDAGSGAPASDEPDLALGAPAAEAPQPDDVAAEPGSDAAEEPEAQAPAAEPTFMDRCLANVAEVNDTTIAQCHGLEISWLHQQSHEPFMASCTAAYGTSDTAIATCQALWLHWWPTE